MTDLDEITTREARKRIAFSQANSYGVQPIRIAPIRPCGEVADRHQLHTDADRVGYECTRSQPHI